MDAGVQGDGLRSEELTEVLQLAGHPVVRRRQGNVPYDGPLQQEPAHMPRVRGTNRGIWRRLKPIPFTRVFEGASKDPDMEEKLLAELPGIFNWALDGLREYLAHGLEDPASVRAAVRAYKQESSPVQRFVKECLEFGPDKEVEAGTALFEAFKEFCETEGIKYTVTKNKVGMDFRNILENDYPHCPVSEPRQVNRGRATGPTSGWGWA